MDQEFAYDFCLTFAGEDRTLVEEIATLLTQAGKDVFYDKYEVANLLGKDLFSYLDDVYRNKARYCVLFASASYASKVWTTHERVSAQARAFQQNSEYILPIRIDDTEIPGLRPTTGYLNVAEYTTSEIAAILLRKLDAEPARKAIHEGVRAIKEVPAEPCEAVKSVVGRDRISPTLNDLVMNCAELFLADVGVDRFPQSGDSSATALKALIDVYDGELQPLLKLFIVGSAYASSVEMHLFLQAIDRIANSHPQTGNQYNDVLLKIRNYPVMMLMYGAGMGALHNRHYDNLNILLTEPVVRPLYQEYQPLPLVVFPGGVIPHDYANQVFGTTRLIAATCEHLYKELSGPMQLLVRDPIRFANLFDTFEIYLATMYADIESERSIQRSGSDTTYGWGPIGRFSYSSRIGNNSAFDIIINDVQQQKENWPPLKGGMYGGSLDRALKALTSIRSLASRAGHY